MSDQAVACPQCGSTKYRSRKSKKYNWKLIALLAIFGTIAIVSLQSRYADEAAERQSAKSPELLAKEAKLKKDQQQQAALTAAAVKTIRSAMKDPTAFSLTSAFAGLNGSGCIEYRAKNSFGAIFPGSAIVQNGGAILLEEKDKNRFVAAWNKACTSGGTDLKAMVEYVAELK